MIFRKTLGNDDDEENENDEFEAERQGMGRRRLIRVPPYGTGRTALINL